jgi:hypothetical protein
VGGHLRSEAKRRSDRNYYKRNRESILEQNKMYRRRTIEQRTKTQKQYYETHKEEILAYAKKYRLANKNRIRKTRRQHYELNRDKILSEQHERYLKLDKNVLTKQSREWAKANPDKRRKSVLATRKKYLAQGLCWYCGSEQAPGLTVCSDCDAKQRSWNIRYRGRLRDDVISAYGGKCACCGEQNLGFLTMDHPNNDGAEHRRKTGCGTGTKFYAWLRNNKYPSEFQVLCWNCNCGKRDNRGVCPHQTQKLEVVA